VEFVKTLSGLCFKVCATLLISSVLQNASAVVAIHDFPAALSGSAKEKGSKKTKEDELLESFQPDLMSWNYDSDPDSLSTEYNSYGTDVNFGQWVSSGKREASIENGQLRTTSTAPGFRGASITLDSTSLATGTYELSFECTEIASSDPGRTLNAGDGGFVSVWSGSGFNSGNTGGSQFIVQTGTAELIQNGTGVSVQELAAATYTANGQYRLRFDYEATSNSNKALIFFFGAKNSGYPFPVVTYDNIQMSSALEAVPEPSVAVLLILSLGVGMRRKR
jgi:5-hydroxyisourate hydrolase-like protein (transthyretin family)